MAFILGIFGSGDALQRSTLLAALGLDDDGALTFELGRPETGATCVLLQDESGAWQVQLPLVRTPTSAEDLIPPLVSALASIGAWADVILPPPPAGAEPIARSAEELLSAWRSAHDTACAQLWRLCEAQGVPPPPHLPGEALRRLHGWLIALAVRRDVVQPILALDPADGGPTRLAVGLPDGSEGTVLVPPVQALLKNVNGETRVFALDDLGNAMTDGVVRLDLAALRDAASSPLGRVRVVSPVEIVDDEALADHGAPQRHPPD